MKRAPTKYRTTEQLWQELLARRVARESVARLVIVALYPVIVLAFAYFAGR